MAETHPDRASDPNIEEVQRFYGAIEVDGDLYRTKTTVKKIRKEGNKFYTYEIQETELTRERPSNGKEADDIQRRTPNNLVNSVSATKLLKGVEKSYEKRKYLLDDHSKVLDENGDPLEVAIVQIRNLLPSKTSRKTIAVGLAQVIISLATGV